MGPAGLTAVFGMGTGVTPPVWSPENRPAGCQAAPAAIPQWSVTVHKVFTPHRKWWHVRKNQNQPSVIRHLPFAIRHLSFAICHSDRIGEATGSLWLAITQMRSRREPIGVVKLLGC